MQENRQVVFMSNGGENVRRVQEYLQPFSEHLIDWFHNTMWITVLQQHPRTFQRSRLKQLSLCLRAYELFQGRKR